MASLRTVKGAFEYLVGRRYGGVKVVSQINEKLAYKDRTGDGSWENGLAGQNGWFRDERVSCCMKYARENTGANFCGKCGRGINGTVTWGQDEDLEASLDSFSDECEGSGEL